MSSIREHVTCWGKGEQVIRQGILHGRSQQAPVHWCECWWCCLGAMQFVCWIVDFSTPCLGLNCPFRTALGLGLWHTTPLLVSCQHCTCGLGCAWLEHCQTESTTSDRLFTHRPGCNNPQLVTIPAGSYRSCSSDTSCRIFMADAAFCASTTASSWPISFSTSATRAACTPASASAAPAAASAAAARLTACAAVCRW